MRWLVLCLLMAGCATDRSTADLRLAKPAPRPIQPAKLPLPPPQHSVPTLEDILQTADRVRADAYDYVARKHSQPAVIDQMTAMTRDLNAAIAVMRDHAVGGKYRPGDVEVVRGLLDGLRHFLETADQMPIPPLVDAPPVDPPPPQ